MCKFVLFAHILLPGIKMAQHMFPECSSVSKVTLGQRPSGNPVHYPGTVTAYIQDTAHKNQEPKPAKVSTISFYSSLD